MNRIIGVSKTSSCAHFVYLAGDFVICQKHDKIDSYYFKSASCVTCTTNAVQVAVAHDNRIIIKDSMHEIITNGTVQQLYFSPNGSYLVSVEHDGINIYDKLKLVLSLEAEVLCLDFDQILIWISGI